MEPLQFTWIKCMSNGEEIQTVSMYLGGCISKTWITTKIMPSPHLPHSDKTFQMVNSTKSFHSCNKT
jgi:hypothetical protein